ncbi:MAG: LacI family DNA-binding transcriptional regulator [Planctomycetota bacterium]
MSLEKVTVRELAGLAGVSAATVSRALRDHPRISVRTRTRIQNLARRIGYRPNALARALSRGRVESIGFIIGRCRDPYLTLTNFYGPCLSAVSAAVEEANYNLVVFADRSEKEGVLPKMIEERHVAGVIVAEHLDEALRRELEDFRFPHVLVDTSERRETNCIYPRDEGAGVLAVRHLEALGHRDIAYVNTNAEHHACTRTRLAGYLAGMAEAGLPARGGYEVRPIAERLEELFPRRPYATALMCFDDDVAMEALAFLWRRHMRAPDDVSIVGVNDTPMAQRMVPKLTTVSTHAGPMGEAACEMLLERIRSGGDVRSRVFEPTLVVRESTAAARIEVE